MSNEKIFFVIVHYNLKFTIIPTYKFIDVDDNNTTLIASLSVHCLLFIDDDDDAATDTQIFIITHVFRISLSYYNFEDAFNVYIAATIIFWHYYRKNTHTHTQMFTTTL